MSPPAFQKESKHPVLHPSATPPWAIPLAVWARTGGSHCEPTAGYGGFVSPAWYRSEQSVVFTASHLLENHGPLGLNLMYQSW